MSKQSEIVISEQAENDLDEIGDYIAVQSDEERAEFVLRKIAAKIQLYATQPHIGRNRNDLREGMRSFSVYNFVVFYKPIDNGIHVVRVLHGARDLELVLWDEGDEI